MTMPSLHSDRLILRPFREADAEDVARCVGEKVIAATTLSIPHPYTVQMAVEWISTHQEEYSTGKGLNFAVTLAGDGKLVGAIGLGLQPDHDRAEMGYWIAVTQWNNGFATEAAKRVIDFGFEVLTLERVFAQHFATNPASGRVMRKAGMHYEGCLRHHIKKWGRYVDLMVYSILREEWQLGDR
jgi:ribosomal-protein-alanine N-acetyltransferase